MAPVLLEEADSRWEEEAAAAAAAKARGRRPSALLAPLLLRPRRGPAPTAWSCSDLSKAARLLATPRRQASFHDEEEMRRVYSLIYDVFRYKNILNQALINVAFFVKYPQFQERANHVWLLLYDLYNRGFADVQDKAVRQRLFAECGLTDVDCCLTQQQIRLGAAIARIRIKNNALKLSQLLPTHLRDEKVVALDEAPVTGWVNSFLATCEDVGELVERAGLRPSCGRHGCPEDCEYRWDHVCPGFLACHPAQRVALAQSELVRQCHVVLQDRAFCLGSAVLARIVSDLQLSGTVVQTHINSPRTTAYLACLLHCNDRIDTLLAFGAGDRKQEYEEYLQQLDVRNAVVYAERFVDTTADLLPRLEGVCAVLASPPNTYSGVVDPVDLVCSRGGDLAMLEVLADPESGSRDCVNSILQEQRHTLQLSMSQPQVQVVLYETHSIVAAENCDMVARLVAEVNDAARWRHVEEWEPEDSPPPRPEDVVLPDCDLFQLGELPDVCGECFRLDDEGCYLALIRRKEITRLDAKYMIKMAEMRGLFGGGERGAKRSMASGRAQRKKTRGDDDDEDRRPRRSGRRGKVQLERLCAPTHASMMRQTLCQRAEACCGRHHQKDASRLADGSRKNVPGDSQASDQEKRKFNEAPILCQKDRAPNTTHRVLNSDDGVSKIITLKYSKNMNETLESSSEYLELTECTHPYHLGILETTRQLRELNNPALLHANVDLTEFKSRTAQPQGKDHENKSSVADSITPSVPQEVERKREIPNLVAAFARKLENEKKELHNLRDMILEGRSIVIADSRNC